MSIYEWEQEIKVVKKEMKECAKIYGKRSVEYAELQEELDELEDLIEWEETHG